MSAAGTGSASEARAYLATDCCRNWNSCLVRVRVRVRVKVSD